MRSSYPHVVFNVAMFAAKPKHFFGFEPATVSLVGVLNRLGPPRGSHRDGERSSIASSLFKKWSLNRDVLCEKVPCHLHFPTLHTQVLFRHAKRPQKISHMVIETWVKHPKDYFSTKVLPLLPKNFADFADICRPPKIGGSSFSKESHKFSHPAPLEAPLAPARQK